MEATTRLPSVLQRPGLRKLIKYSMVSLISVVVSQVVQFATFVVTHNGVLSSIVAVAVGTVPSYELNRRWTWRKNGPSHLWREIVPFWVMSFVGLVFSTLCVYFAEQWADGRDFSKARTGLLLNLASLAAFGILWVGKFLIINHLLFHHRPLDAADEDDVPVF
ncbi:MAG: GtrA family protein [Acidimicrobiia bacterium]